MNRMPKIMLSYKPNGRRRLGRPLNRLLEAETGLLRPNSWRMTTTKMMMTYELERATGWKYRQIRLLYSCSLHCVPDRRSGEDYKLWHVNYARHEILTIKVCWLTLIYTELRVIRSKKPVIKTPILQFSPASYQVPTMLLDQIYNHVLHNLELRFLQTERPSFSVCKYRPLWPLAV
jgi:hypothetical protein